MRKLVVMFLFVLSVFSFQNVKAMQPPDEPEYGVVFTEEYCSVFYRTRVELYVLRDEVPAQFLNPDVDHDEWVLVNDSVDVYNEIGSGGCTQRFDIDGDLFGHGYLSKFRVQLVKEGEEVGELYTFNEDIVYQFSESPYDEEYYILDINRVTFEITPVKQIYDPSSGVGEGITEVFTYLFIIGLTLLVLGIMTLIECTISYYRSRGFTVPIGILFVNLLVFIVYLGGIFSETLTTFFICTGISLTLLGLKLFLASRHMERVMKLYVFSMVIYLGLMAIIYSVANSVGVFG